MASVSHTEPTEPAVRTMKTLNFTPGTQLSIFAPEINSPELGWLHLVPLIAHLGHPILSQAPVERDPPVWEEIGN